MSINGSNLSNTDDRIKNSLHSSISTNTRSPTDNKSIYMSQSKLYFYLNILIYFNLKKTHLEIFHL